MDLPAKVWIISKQYTEEEILEEETRIVEETGDHKRIEENRKYNLLEILVLKEIKNTYIM